MIKITGCTHKEAIKIAHKLSDTYAVMIVDNIHVKCVARQGLEVMK